MDISAALDQMSAFLRDLAPVMNRYYIDLVYLGFSEEQAFELTKEMQKSLIPNQSK